MANPTPRPRRARQTFAAALLLTLGCSSGPYESATLRLSWKLPRGAALLDEQAGPPRVARFSGGLSVTQLEGSPLPVGAGEVSAVQQAVQQQLGGAELTPLTCVPGNLPAGPVARLLFKRGSRRVLAYYLPDRDRALLLVLEQEAAASGPAENHFERSLSSLALR